MKQPKVYILSNASKTLYIGVTSNLELRISQHKQKELKGFSEKYNLNKLVYFETFPTMSEAIERERQLKGWVRSKKIVLIEEMNPEWNDLSNEDENE